MKVLLPCLFIFASIGWSPYVRGGDLSQQRYLQVFFANRMLVDRMTVEQGGASKMTQIRLSYSDDGQSFLDADKVSMVPEMVT